MVAAKKTAYKQCTGSDRYDHEKITESHQQFFTLLAFRSSSVLVRTLCTVMASSSFSLRPYQVGYCTHVAFFDVVGGLSSIYPIPVSEDRRHGTCTVREAQVARAVARRRPEAVEREGRIGGRSGSNERSARAVNRLLKEGRQRASGGLILQYYYYKLVRLKEGLFLRSLADYRWGVSWDIVPQNRNKSVPSVSFERNSLLLPWQILSPPIGSFSENM